MSIKEQIENLPDDIVWIAGKEHPSCPGLIGQTIDIQGKQLDQSDLKALAASHGRLIRNLRVMASAAEHKSDLLPESFKIAWDTIEEAEKL